MRIGLVTQRFITGEGQGYINYAVAWAALQRGHSLVLVGNDIDPDLRAHEQVTWVPVSSDAWPTQLLRDQVFAWKSRRALQPYRSELDLLMVNGAITWGPADVNALHFVHSAWKESSARSRDGRSVWHHWYQVLYTQLNALWERWAVRRARHAVAVSPMVEDEIEALEVPTPVHTIPNGVDTKAFAPRGPTLSPSDLGCPVDAPIALFVGDLQRSVKNLDTVIRALTRLPGLHLAVAGRVEGSPFPSLAARLDVDDRVHFLGFRRDIPTIMRTTDFFVFPSRYEPFSLVVLEAMACGLPVITADTVGAADLVTPEAGIVLDSPDDTTALTEAMYALATDADRRDRMGRAARDIAVDHDIRSTADAYVDLFERVSTKQPAKRINA